MLAASVTHVLQAAVQEQLQQFEPQLLPLFGGSRNVHARGTAPTAHTHTALKTLVALTRYFPEEHRVHKAGKQLELIWPPLVHEARGAVAGRLLHYYFRVRQDLLDAPQTALRLAMLELVAAGIAAPQVVLSPARSLDCLRRLHQLAEFLPGAAVGLVQHARMTPLGHLFLWQQQLELPAAGAESWASTAQNVLVPFMQGARERCAKLCAASDWSLDYYCLSGLARSLWQLRGMALVAGNSSAAEALALLDDACLDLHLAGKQPDAQCLQAWLARLFADTPATRAEGLAPAAAETDPALRSLYAGELGLYQTRLGTELQPAPGPVSADLITLLYKAAWVFTAVGKQAWARLCHCAYRLVQQFWRTRRPLPPASHAVLWHMTRELGAELPPTQLRSWRQALVQDWPGWAGDGKRPIALRASAAPAVPLDAVPLLLSGSFATLVRVPAEPCAATPEHCRQLLQELVLLEQGAAAMKVWPLEQLCTALITVYETYLREAAGLPEPLLAQAHRQLVCMLDQSAAWQEAQGDATVLQALEDWLAQQSCCREPACGSATSGDAAGERWLRSELLAFLGTLAAVLERPVRLRLDTGGVCLDGARLAQVLECLKPLVKFMLLDRSVDARARQAMHKPRVSTLTVGLRATSATLILSAAEDSHEDTLPPAEVQRLQRRLPKAAGALVCESRAGQGRCFTCTLS